MITPKVLIESKQAEAALTTQYTAVNCKTIIDKCTVTNVSGVNVNFTLHLVPSGGSADATNSVITTRAIAPGECYTCPEAVGHKLESGGFISTLAGAVSSLVIRASGREITS